MTAFNPRRSRKLAERLDAILTEIDAERECPRDYAKVACEYGHDARTSLPEACRRLEVLKPIGPNIAENLQVVESDGDFDFVLIRIPIAQAKAMLEALTWEETNDG